MLVSMKYLSLIHFVPSVGTTGMDMAQAAHKSVIGFNIPTTCSVRLEPLSKSSVQGLVLGLGDLTGLFDEVRVST